MVRRIDHVQPIDVYPLRRKLHYIHGMWSSISKMPRHHQLLPTTLGERLQLPKFPNPQHQDPQPGTMMEMPPQIDRSRHQSKQMRIRYALPRKVSAKSIRSSGEEAAPVRTLTVKTASPRVRTMTSRHSRATLSRFTTTIVMIPQAVMTMYQSRWTWMI